MMFSTTFFSNWGQQGNTDSERAGNFIYTFHSCHVMFGVLFFPPLIYLFLCFRYCICSFGLVKVYIYMYIQKANNVFLCFLIGGDASLSSCHSAPRNFFSREGNSLSSVDELNGFKDGICEASNLNNGYHGI